jgi:Acyl-CoA dehydrogenase, C-terminal domain
MTSATVSSHDEFFAIAQQAIATSGAAAALDTLGWWDLLAHLDEPDMRLAVFAFFRAQGNGLGTSPALGGLLAQPFLADTDLAPGDAVATIRRQTSGGPVHVVVGDPGGRRLLIDEPGHGAELVDPGDVEFHPIDINGRLALTQVKVSRSTSRVTIPEELAAAARERSIVLGRVAIAAEILGASERSLELATDYAIDRQQFGRPIGTFQAIRHLLAWGRTECIAIDAVVHQAIRFHDTAPPHFDEVVKALAGRNARRVCERTLQVLGGIGFTTEHDHHHLHSRVLALDSLLGTSADMTYQLGNRLRTTGTNPGFPAAMLHQHL